MSGPAAWHLAACQYPVTFLADLASYRRKIESLVSEAATAGARLLLFPEYGAMELASLLASREPQDLRRQLDALQDLLDFARREGILPGVVRELREKYRL